jgi:hypothetical protein
MSQLQDFISAIKSDGLARTNLYGVQFTLPFLPSMQPLQSFASRKMALYAADITIPTLYLNTQEIENLGESYEIATTRKFQEDFTIDFYVDSNYSTVELFHRWILNISDPESKNVGYLDDYSTSLVVFAQDRNSNNLCNYIFEKAFPKSVKLKNYSYAEASFQVVNVSFGYYRYSFVPNASVYDFENYDGNGLTNLPSVFLLQDTAANASSFSAAQIGTSQLPT